MRFRRARRIAACTALALSAGMLLATPAAADDAPAAPAPLEQTRPSLRLPELKLPESSAAAVERGVAAATADDVPMAKPRNDVDGDGLSDLLYRAGDGLMYLDYSADGTGGEYTFPAASDDRFKDFFSIAGLQPGTTRPVHFTLTAAGYLSAYDTTGGNLSRVWSGTGWQAYNKVFSPGDLTGDGSGDILARTPSGDLWMYRTTPGAASPMAARVKVGTGWGVYDQLTGVNDVNGDAIADMFARTPSGDLYFYSGKPDGVQPFKGRVLVGGGWGAYNQIFGIDDINGDGYSEVLGRSVSGVMYGYYSTGVGTFEARQQFSTGTGWEVVSQFEGAGNNPHVGKDEVYGHDTKGSLFEYYVRNNGLLSARRQTGDTGGWSGSKLTFASSLDGDGVGDMLEVYNGTLYNLSYPSDEPPAIGSGWGIYTMLVGPGDLSGDGKGDLLARDSAGALYLYKGNGTGTGFAARIKLGTGWNTFNKLVGAGDINGDGLADVVARTTGGSLYLYPGSGVATAPFKARTLIGSGWGGFNKLASPGDMDGDGKADLLAVNSAGTLYRYSANGTGGYKGKVSLGGGWNTYSSLL
ncbi:FG-GAP repeat domain-containing protein [Streptomyces sp. NPDC052236]|uniref:FG-GAP repeat domain-containing protein n=1 Tax=Streptomyces sp. NPDC052236 TaxID=3365686 RepID=UPI0037D630F3